MRAVLVGISLGVCVCGANAQGAADSARGQTIFNQQCHVCHQVGAGAKSLIGPELNGIAGQKPGAVPGYSFSPAMMQAASKGIVWDAANLDKYLESPQAFIPGTKMAYAGLKDPQQRRDLIAYIETLKAQ